MLSEKELISKLQELREIKPQAEWASLTKSRILSPEPSFSFWKNLTSPYLLRPAFVSLVVVFVFLTGLYGFAKNSLPGDVLYSIKKITEKSQSVFVSEQEKSQFNLNLASKRLEELTRIAEENRVKNLASAINEVKESIARASRDLSGDTVVIRDTADRIKEKVKVMGSYGVATEEFEEELYNLEQGVYKMEVEYLISILKARDLTEKQEEILIEMQKLAEKKEYAEALILYTGFDNQADNDNDIEEIEDEEEFDEEDEEEEEGEENNDEEEIKE